MCNHLVYPGKTLNLRQRLENEYSRGRLGVGRTMLEVDMGQIEKESFLNVSGQSPELEDT